MNKPCKAKTVICFDSWTQGARYLIDLVEPFKNLGLKLVLIHVGSWGHEPQRADEEWFENLLVRDIRYYGSLSLLQILEKESPEGVLFLSLQAFSHRAINRYCQKLNIPTMHLYHGLVNVAVTNERIYKVSLKSQVSIFKSRISDNLAHVLPQYCLSLYKTKASLSDWLWFLKDLWRKALGTSYSMNAAPDATTQTCCVYTDADRQHAIERYGMHIDRVYSVGNPDIARFGLKKEMLGSHVAPLTQKLPKVIYIDTALIDAGLVFDDAIDFVGHLENTARNLKIQGFCLAVKLHPAHFRTGVIPLLASLDIEIIDDSDFLYCLQHAAAALVEPSSAAMIPALMGLPLLLVKYDKFSDQKYGNVLMSYPKSCVIKDLEIVGNEIKRVSNLNCLAKTIKWIEKNSGPLPAEQMPIRVAEHFYEML